MTNVIRDELDEQEKIRAYNTQIAAIKAVTDNVDITALYKIKFNPPSALGWSSSYPLSAVQLENGSFTSLVNPRSLVNPAIFAGTSFYVDVNAGQNSNSGRGPSNPVKSINDAITKGNATGAPYQIFIKAGNYQVNDSINGYPTGWPTPPVSPLIEPTQHCAFIAVDGRVRHSAQINVTSFPTNKDGTYTNCYAISSAGTRRVFSRTSFDSYGNFLEYTNAADLASCNSTPNSWYQSGSTLYINQSTAPTYDTNLICSNTYTASFYTCTKDLYFEGIDFEGGQQGALHVDPLATHNVVAVDCTFKYAGSSATPIDGVRVRRVSGITAFFRCDASCNSKDGFNFHADGATAMHVLTVNCYGIDNGKFSSTSNNGLTTHDDIINIDIGSYYGPQYAGASVHNIENTKCWLLGTIAERSSLNGSSSNSAIKVTGPGIMYIENCQAYAESGSVPAIFVQSTAGIMYYSNIRSFVGTVTVDGGCTYSEYKALTRPDKKANTLYALVAPTVDDDVTKGYYPGSIWIDKTAGTGTAKICLDNTKGAAVWA